MESALLIKAAIALVAAALWVIGKAASASSGSAPMAATPPPLMRRARRVRNAPAPVAATPAPEAPVSLAATHLDASSLVVTRPARAHTRGQFRGSAALRQAVIAREVLGLPLALRPPRS